MRATKIAVLAAFLIPSLLSGASPLQTDPPQREAPRQSPPARKPHDPGAQKPPERAAPRPPETRRPEAKPPDRAEPRQPSDEARHAVPRPPEARGETVRPPNRRYVYPGYDRDLDLGFYFGFPYTPYPYWRMYPPFGHPAPAPWWWEETAAYGSVRLLVPQTDAAVYVDGFYVGIVANYDGFFQQLTLAAGPHRIEIRAPGYEALTFMVNVVPGQTITYRGELWPQS